MAVYFIRMMLPTVLNLAADLGNICLMLLTGSLHLLLLYHNALLWCFSHVIEVWHHLISTSILQILTYALRLADENGSSRTDGYYSYFLLILTGGSS